MTERSLQTRLTATSERSYTESVALAHQWESIRHQWFETSGLRDQAADAAARMRRLEREYLSETGAELNG